MNEIKSQNLKICGCIPRGHTIIKCYLEKYEFYNGETAKIFVEIDNSHCSLDLANITCVLKRLIIIKSEKGIFKKIVVIYIKFNIFLNKSKFIYFYIFKIIITGPYDKKINSRCSVK